MRGRKPKPTALKRLEGNPGKRPIRGDEPQPPRSQPSCPGHLSPAARAEWARLAQSLNGIGLLTQVDRAALAAYCQAYGRWVEAERKLKETPVLLKTPAGYVQQSPWLTVSNKQMELMAKYMAELGLTPSSRRRLAIQVPIGPKPWEEPFDEFSTMWADPVTRRCTFRSDPFGPAASPAWLALRKH
jgi:P27 family predicted phage terminase small subunit